MNDTKKLESKLNEALYFLKDLRFGHELAIKINKNDIPYHNASIIQLNKIIDKLEK